MTRKSKVIFNGTGMGWFPMPRFLIGNVINPGTLFKMNVSPELRLYLGLLSESGKAESPVVTLDNAYVKELARLNRNYLSTARKDLETLQLIRTQRAGMSAYRYEILNADGRSLSDKTVDDWGMVSGLEYARHSVQIEEVDFTRPTCK
jgi:hypothetical protein